MRLHVIQHVPFEDPGFITDWAEIKRHPITVTRLFDNQPLPDDPDDLLIILGGSMGVNDDEPWLDAEKTYIAKMIERGAPMLGICLGAQLMAEVLGAEVTKNPEKEIGWHPVTFTHESIGVPLLSGFPLGITPFHWHTDTFTIPDGAVRIARSAGCPNQGFFAKGHLLGLQFHLETTMAGIGRMIQHAKADMTSGKYVMNERDILGLRQLADESNILMARLMDNFAAACVC